jgi:hypothetical protein
MIPSCDRPNQNGISGADGGQYTKPRGLEQRFPPGASHFPVDAAAITGNYIEMSRRRDARAD